MAVRCLHAKLEAAPILQPFGSVLSGSDGSLALASAIALASSGTCTSNMSHVVKSKTLGHVGQPGNIWSDVVVPTSIIRDV